MLNGGSWVADKTAIPVNDDVYHAADDQNLSMSVILQDGRRFDFDDVRHAYATIRDGKLRTVDVASCGHSQQAIVDRLKRMHESWNGFGIGDISKWRSEIDGGVAGPHQTVIHRSIGPDDPSITAAIRDNFGGADDAWFIMVTYFWNTH